MEQRGDEQPRQARPRRRWTGRVRASVLQFALVGLAAVVLLGVVGVILLRDTAEDEATREAKEVTSLAGRGIVQPALGDAVLRGDPAARAAFDRVVRSRVLSSSVVRVKIWTPDGRVVYSDEPRLIGSTYALGADELEALRGGEAAADVSDLSRPENRFERSEGKLIEVYLPITSQGGRKLLFEAYLRSSAIASDTRHLWLAFAPALVGALLLLWLVQIPLAGRMGRRLEEGQREREALLMRAIESSELERRRIAGHLHDGAVQNLAGIAYSLSAEAEETKPDREGVRRAAAEIRQVNRELRALLVDIYPPALHEEGLEAALADLIAPVTGQGVECSVDVAPNLKLQPEIEALFFRTAQEALRNVLKHAEARHVEVRALVEDHQCSLTIEDDGRGFEPERNGAAAEGHFGLRLLSDLARDLDGRLDVDSTPGRGTRVRMEVPLR